MDRVNRVSDIYKGNYMGKSRKPDAAKEADGRVIVREGPGQSGETRRGPEGSVGQPPEGHRETENGPGRFREENQGGTREQEKDKERPQEKEDGKVQSQVRQDAAVHAQRMQGGRYPDAGQTGRYRNQGGQYGAGCRGLYGDPKEKKQEGYGLVAQLQARAEAMKDAFDPKKKKNLYDATMDLMLLEQAEKIPALKAMQSRLHFKIRAVKASGAKPGEIRRAVTKLKKVIAKVKAKVKNLKKEEQLEKKRKKAEEARRKAREAELRRELERRKKVRKAREKNDIEESKMGMGANYGGPGDVAAGPVPADVHTSIEGAAPSVEAGAVIDVAVADMGAAAETAVDVGV